MNTAGGISVFRVRLPRFPGTSRKSQPGFSGKMEEDPATALNRTLPCKVFPISFDYSRGTTVCWGGWKNFFFSPPNSSTWRFSSAKLKVARARARARGDCDDVSARDDWVVLKVANRLFNSPRAREIFAPPLARVTIDIISSRRCEEYFPENVPERTFLENYLNSQQRRDKECNKR